MEPTEQDLAQARKTGERYSEHIGAVICVQLKLEIDGHDLSDTIRELYLGYLCAVDEDATGIYIVMDRRYGFVPNITDDGMYSGEADAIPIETGEHRYHLKNLVSHSLLLGDIDLDNLTL